MYQRYKERFGTVGIVIGVIALVLALVTGAYAAGGGLSGKQKKEVEKIAKKYAGKPGAAGAPGLAGPAGAAGKNGTNGTNGTDGTNVTTAPIATSSATCNHNGGVEVKSASPAQNVCNGTTGFTETLPEGKTETGEWALIGDAAGGFEHFADALSFNIPLEAAPTPHYIRTSGLEPVWNSTEEKEEEVAQPDCPGSAAAPAAEPGSLCVYASAEVNTEKSPIPQVVVPRIASFATEGVNPFAAPAADPYGFGLYTFSKEAGVVNVTGTWAVTAG